MRETSCIRAVSSGNPAIDRFDTLVHALAQLPDSVTLRLSGAHNRASLCLIARAYGIEDRLVFSPADTDGGMVVAHVDTAQGHPNETTSAVLFDAAGDPRDDSDGLTLAELIDRFKDKTDKASLHEDCGLLSQARIAVITNLPAPYRIPLFSTIAVRLGEQGAAFRVFFLGPGDHDRPWMSHRGELGFPFQMLHSVATSRGHRPRLLPLDLELALRRFKPTMIVCGGLSPAVALRASLAARALGAVFGVWSGDHSRMSTAQSRLRRVTRQLVARRARFALAYGSLSAEYLRDLNGELPTVIARNTSALAQHSGRPESQPDAPLQLLAVGDLASRRKGIDILIAALRRLPDLRCRLRVVGSGAMLTDLAALSRDDPRVEFLGAVPPARMPQTYSDAEVFLFPSRAEVFGLALVEAMHAGLAPVTSAFPGAVADLCVHESNSLILVDHRPETWAAAIRRLAEDTPLRRKLRDGARRTIAARWTNAHSADAFIGGLRLGQFVAANSHD